MKANNLCRYISTFIHATMKRSIVMNLESEKLLVQIDNDILNVNPLWNTIFSQIDDLRSPIVSDSSNGAINMNSDLLNKAISLENSLSEIATALYNAASSQILMPLVSVSKHPANYDVSSLVADTVVYNVRVQRKQM